MQEKTAQCALRLVELKKWLNNSGTLTQLRNKDANERTTFPEGAWLEVAIVLGC